MCFGGNYRYMIGVDVVGSFWGAGSTQSITNMSLFFLLSFISQFTATRHQISVDMSTELSCATNPHSKPAILPLSLVVHMYSSGFAVRWHPCVTSDHLELIDM